ncbi:MAG: hypothetical protein RLZZ573_1553, partial [Pseudomonadota bacterium]
MPIRSTPQTLSMLDRFITALIRPAVNASAKLLVRAGVGANSITLLGFFVGMLAAFLIATHAYSAALVAIFA